MRRQFTLMRADEANLIRRDRPWEAVLEGTAQWIILHEFDIPSGYNIQRASVAVQLVAGYPGAPLDMAYFLPHLARADNKPINALSPHQFDGKVWQRWSRHRNGTNPWIEGEDNLATHMAYVESWLRDEFRKRP